jgi:predicted cupin superfamily sugar epimerase
MKNARYWIEALDLERHPEGGYYKESYRSSEIIQLVGLPGRFPGPRVFSTSIYFLLSDNEVSYLHRIKSDEIWHFYTGSSLAIHVIEPQGGYQKIMLGQGIEMGEVLQGVVKAGCWFGAKVEGTESYSLVSCNVAPGFEFEDFELADRSELLQIYPQHHEIIELLTEPSQA